MARARIVEKVSIHICPMEEKIRVEEQVDGITSVKSISPDDLVACFESSIKEEKRIESGFLPEHCLSYAVSDSTKTLTLWHPALRVDYTYHKTTYENFPIPRMVFRFDLNSNGRVTNSWAAVLADEKPKPGTQLYRWPFSNLYRDGSICIGAANSLPAYKNLWTLHGLPNLILTLPNNDHNYDRADNKLKLSYRELLDHLQDKDPSYYYEHVLIPRKGATLQHFIENKLGGKHG